MFLPKRRFANNQKLLLANQKNMVPQMYLDFGA